MKTVEEIKKMTPKEALAYFKTCSNEELGKLGNDLGEDVLSSLIDAWNKEKALETK